MILAFEGVKYRTQAPPRHEFVCDSCDLKIPHAQGKPYCVRAYNKLSNCASRELCWKVVPK